MSETNQYNPEFGKLFEHLESTLETIRVCTQPIPEHSDPNSVQDCWAEVADTIQKLKGASGIIELETIIIDNGAMGFTEGYKFNEIKRPKK